MGITEEGIKGEQKLFKWLRSQNYEFFQPDAIARKKDSWYVFEAKNQERFRPPPFEGHGLPKWQVEARLRFQEEFGIVAIFIVFEKDTNNIFIQRIDKLERGAFYDSLGAKPRRIYKLDSFIKL